MRDVPAQTVIEGLSWVYDRLLHQKRDASAMVNEDAADTAIRWAAAQAGLVGFTTGLGGAFTLPISLPMNVAGVSAIQIHMVQEIARARGYDLRSAQVRTLTIGCLAGSFHGAKLDCGAGVRLAGMCVLGLDVA